MGYTIEDMMLVSKNRYNMKMIAGKNGWSNSIVWTHMLEETTIVQNFWGKELAVTTGLGFRTTESLMELAREMVKHHGAGLILNTGHYIKEVPQELLDYCDENDFPLLTVPQEIHMGDMIKDINIRIFLQDSADEQISNAMIKAIEVPDNQDAYRKELLPYFDVDGTFQVVLITLKGLDTMDTVERKKLSYRIQMYLEKITHNGNFFYYDSFFVLVVNDVQKKDLDEIVEGMLTRAKKRMVQFPLYVGVGSEVVDISNLYISFMRAKGAVKMSLRHEENLKYFDDLGLFRLLYSVNDTQLLEKMKNEPLKELMEYDNKHKGNYVDTLECYLKHNGSIQAVAEEMFTHRNTVIYRISNIKKLINNDLATPDERLPYQIAYYIRKM
ncbi:PucR family transcriptional regulator [Lachnobacterium bovis]|uniref:PucR C-terminal helix-turn-helix domain-containing protein n=1 Tax=Lachnobacterium bovis TaxID=140626 RepID=A0A1H9TZU3_9FIRM|nr:PucR family transcriptional regulator ligand-binding domain-containing protein [Lachnobacterium bovis]SES02481.1 PucR C-terminal helix-turn-helix domain-containing protein [Lachnobacterium bovis]